MQVALLLSAGVLSIASPPVVDKVASITGTFCFYARLHESEIGD
jgi:hypothetical protein